MSIGDSENATAVPKSKKLYLLEKCRLESFKSWPFDDSQACSIKKMAEAGFYWCGSEKENDTVACFMCGKTLDGWEAQDEPWSEHRKHAPQCSFVNIGKVESDLTVQEFLILLKFYAQNNLQVKFTKMKKNFQKNIEQGREEIVKNYRH